MKYELLDISNVSKAKKFLLKAVKDSFIVHMTMKRLISHTLKA